MISVKKTDLNKLRGEIDKTNKDIIKALARRFVISEKVGIYKKKNGLKPFDPKREKEMFKKMEAVAKQEKVNPELVVKIFKLITKDVRRRHREIKNE